jgi:hypothetical protein
MRVSKQKKEKLPERQCAHCEEIYQPERWWQKYCSAACKQAAWLKSHYGEKDAGQATPTANKMYELFQLHPYVDFKRYPDGAFLIKMDELEKTRTAEFVSETSFDEALDKALRYVRLKKAA